MEYIVFSIVGLVVGFFIGGASAFYWVKSFYEKRMNDIRLTDEKLKDSFASVASSVLKEHAKQFEEGAGKDLKQITTAAEGQIALHKQAISSAVDDLKTQLQGANKKSKISKKIEPISIPRLKGSYQI